MVKTNNMVMSTIAATTSTDPTLVIQKSNKYYLDKDTCTIGRNHNKDLCEVVISRGYISKHHASIKKIGDDYIIIDNNSRNGTYVNGDEIISSDNKYGISSARILRTGDIISFAGQEDLFRFINPSDPLFVTLTKQQLKVLKALADYPDLSEKEIADKLVISVNTVRTHKNKVFELLGAHSRGEAIDRARLIGLID